MRKWNAYCYHETPPEHGDSLAAEVCGWYCHKCGQILLCGWPDSMSGQTLKCLTHQREQAVVEAMSKSNLG